MPQDIRTFAYKVQEGYLHNDRGAMMNAFDEYQRSHCYDPHRIFVVPAHDGLRRSINVDCGQCYHCRESKINSWVTRMYAHCEDFPYVYFVTLTYRPFYSLGDVSRLVFQKLSGALYHYDNCNKEHRFGWNPCLLCKRHYQLFLKRLRKNTNNNSLTYVVCGEYGHTYGRPHYHLILFSKQPICENDVRRAWSVGLWKSDSNEWSFLRNQRHGGKAYYFEIGRIQFDDLVSNGSFNQKQLFIDGQNMNARNCFAYVCKYVCKGGECNEKRLRLAFDSLYERKQVKRPLYGDFYEKFMYMSHEERIKAIHFNHLELHTSNEDSLNHYVTYYETFLKNDDRLFVNDLVTFEIYPENYRSFSAMYGQFVEVSRGCPIGSVYAKTHIDQFVAGIFAKPVLQDKSFVVPSYFRQKAEAKVYGLRKRKQTVRSKSFVFSCLPDLLAHFEEVFAGRSAFKYCDPIDLFNSRANSFKYKDSYFKDIWTGELIYFPKFGKYTQAEYYRYNRSSRHYELQRITSLNEFLRTYIPRLKESIQRYNTAVSIGEQNDYMLKRSQILLEEYGYSLKNLRTRFAEKQKQYLTFRDNTYHDVHESVE